MRRKLIPGLIASAALLCAAEPAFAQSRMGIGSGNNWRQHDRRNVRNTVGTPQRFAFELRFGAYYPAIDDEFGGRVTPYEDMFGSGPKFHFGAEFDWQVLRIPYVGSFGPGVGLGFTTTTAKAYASGRPIGEDGKIVRTEVDTSLQIVPMHASAVLRIDELFRRTGFPFVPYGKLGFGAALWSVGVGDETANVDGVSGRGLSLGYHWALGGMVALDGLSPRSMASLDAETGVNHIHVFGEWMNDTLGTFGGSQMRVGTSTWVLGLTMEM